MGYCVVTQPSGLFAVLSTTVDDLVLVNATQDDIVEMLLERAREDVVRVVARIVQSPYTPEEAADVIREAHGDERAAVALREMLDPDAPPSILTPPTENPS